MKKRLLTLLVFFWYGIILSQNSFFERGYFIDNNNKKVECLIKNLQWEINPTEFEYKTAENSETKSISFNEFKEFSVGGEYKFIKANVKIDKSFDNRESASSIKAMNFVDDVLLLRVRVEGNATLYSYNSGNYLRFFYSINPNSILPLSYKLYYNKEEFEVAENEAYKQEIFNSLKCEKITQANINNLEYKSSSLSDLFIKYNLCTGSGTVKFEEKKNYNTFELYAKAGIGIVDFSYNYVAAAVDLKYSKKTNFKIGIEGEANLSDKVKRWSGIFGLSYQQYSNSYTIEYTTNHVIYDMDYKSIDALIGIRTYFNLSSKSYLFANGGLIYAVEMKSKIGDLDITNALSPVVGFGCLYNKKYSIELNYEFGRNLATNDTGVRTSFKVINVTIGYKIL